MKKIEFSVGAKAARLIGRENISEVDGALIELIKNGYDADASCVLISFVVPFPNIPRSIEISRLNSILSENDVDAVLKFYDMIDGSTLRKKELTLEEQNELMNILFAYNKIIVADNGYGMDYKTLTTSWMYIGTSDKENNPISPKGRIKTGAKGIGRFALDKLSKKTLLYTKAQNSENILSWSMDWGQFEKARLINDVEADIEEAGKSYSEIIARYFGNCENILKDYDWTSGTLIVLSPTRETWSNRRFNKVNKNLNSINPIGSVDRFDVIVKNEFYPQFDYETKKAAISDDDYDYRISARYDGNEKLYIDLYRNEIDFSVSSVTVEKYGRTATKSVDDFWKREKLQKEGYKKEDYNKTVFREYDINDIFPEDEIENIKRLGKFETEMYFLRIDSSEKIQITKKVVRNRRSELSKNFSGIKIYRDSFKVRPYGDMDEDLYDWLNLGVRAQKSPAAPSHTSGQWRVRPYQMIGWVMIGRESNPMLEDMANREGLASNEYYYIFRDMLVRIIEEFEYDRQYVLREYGKWIKSIEKELSDYVDRIRERAERAYSDNKKTKNMDNEDENDDDEEFTKDEYLGAVKQISDDNEERLNKEQIQQILSSSGIVLNTFFHEFNAINTQFHIEAPQIRSRVNYILGGKPYEGIPAYDPYKRIAALEKSDKLTAAFLDVVMEGLKKENLKAKEIDLVKELSSVIKLWEQILDEKKITLQLEINKHKESSCKWRMAIVDLYIVVNNFMLNSAWFLQREHNDDRIVKCIFDDYGEELQLILQNNGPVLAPEFKYNPDKIFELGVTSKVNEESKSEGTGLGLWITRDVIERNNGTVNVLDLEKGFGLIVKFKP